VTGVEGEGTRWLARGWKRRNLVVGDGMDGPTRSQVSQMPISDDRGRRKSQTMNPDILLHAISIIEKLKEKIKDKLICSHQKMIQKKGV
jgi:hypothetical protein